MFDLCIVVITLLFLFYFHDSIFYCAYCYFNDMFYNHFVASLEYWINETINQINTEINKILLWFTALVYIVGIYRVSQEECARLRESVPYVKLYRYNPKHLYPKLNCYGDNSQRKVWSSSVSTYCTPSVTSYLSNAPARQLDMVMQWPWRMRYSAR